MRKLVYIILVILIRTVVYGQDCNITSKANDMLPDKLCAPVTVTWEVTYRGVNDAGTPVEIVFDWNDGNPVQIVPAVNTNPALKEWKVTVVHVYPQGGPRCNYRPEATLRVNGILCTSSVQQQNVTVWDTDNYNGGQLQINPVIFPICVGNDGTVTFQDVSLWNCVPPVENDNPNDPTRWTQWVYGSSYTINGVLVGGTAYTYPFYGPVVPAPGPVYGPQPPNNVSLPVYAPNTALVGQFFEVTLRNWNVCNPYDDPNIPGPPTDPINGDYPPITTTAIILIVPYPDATIQPVGPFCSNASAINLQAATPGGTWSGPGITNSTLGTFNPSVAGPGTHTITYHVTNAYGCTGVGTTQITVFARPNINMQPGTNLTICPGDTLYLNANPTSGNPNGGAIATHLWTGATTYLNTTNIPNPYFVCNTPGTYNLTYRVTDVNGCWRQQNITIQVTQVSANILPDPAQACAGVPLQLNGNPSGGTGNYTVHIWTGADSLLSFTSIQNPVFLSTIPGTYSLHYFVQDNLGCSATDNIVIQVSATPTANAGTDDSVCGKTYTLHAIPSIGNGSWSLIDGPGLATFQQANDANSLVTVTLYGTYYFQWLEIYGYNCVSKDTVRITFIEIPASNAGQDKSLCGLQTTLDAIPSVGSGTWTLFSGPGNCTITNPDQPNTTIQADTYGSYTFVWHEDNTAGCTNSDTVTIHFDVVPVAAFQPVNSSGCSPFTIQFQNTSQYGHTYLWKFSDNTQSTDENPIHTFYNTTSQNVQYTILLIATSEYGCKDSVLHTLIVHPLPKSQFNHDAQPACSPITVNFTNSSIDAVQYLWDFGDGTQSDHVHATHIFVNNTTLIQYFTVKLIATNIYGCNDTSLQYITVYPDPDYTITPSPAEECSPATITFLTQPGAQQYIWNFGNGVSQQGTNIIQYTYINPTFNQQIFNVQLIASNFFGCIDTSYVTITVNPKPVANFTIQSIETCSPALFNFTNQSQNANQLRWYWGDGTYEDNTTASLQHTYINNTATPQTFNVSLVATNIFNCKDSIALPLTVYPSVNASFTAPQNGCSPLLVHFQNQSSSNVNYQWNFGNGQTSQQQNPVHEFINTSNSPQQFNVVLTISSIYGCSDSSSSVITVYPKPTAQFSVQNPDGCAPFTAQFQNQSSGANNFLYHFGDQTTSTSPNSIVTHLYDNITSNPANYTCWLIVQNSYGCKDSSSQIITVYPRVLASFTSDTAGCTPLLLTFNNYSMYASNYTWNFGDGNTSTAFQPNHTYTNNTTGTLTYTVTLTATSNYGCTATYQRNIYVYAVPNVSFTVDSTVLHYPNTTVVIDNTTPGVWQYTWNFGDGTTSSLIEPISHTFPNYGNYTITLTAFSPYCRDSASQTIHIVPPPPIAHYIPSYASGCLPLSVSFTNQSQYATSYVWSFGDGNTSNETHPTYTYSTAGSYTVSLTAIGPGGQNTYSAGQVDVYANAIAYFTVSPSVVFIPSQPVQCINLSQNATSYLWNFGDGITSTEINPKHYYTQEGEYHIQLIANNQHNCPDTFTVYRAVVAKSEGKIEFPSAFTPNPNGPNGGHYNPNDYNNDVFHPVFVGVDKYKLSIFNRWGELIFESDDPYIGWDGYYRGELCKQDVYVWKVSGKFVNGQSFFKAGDVTLLR